MFVALNCVVGRLEATGDAVGAETPLLLLVANAVVSVWIVMNPELELWLVEADKGCLVEDEDARILEEWVDDESVESKFEELSIDHIVDEGLPLELEDMFNPEDEALLMLVEFMTPVFVDKGLGVEITVDGDSDGSVDDEFKGMDVMVGKTLCVDSILVIEECEFGNVDERLCKEENVEDVPKLEDTVL